MDRLVGDVQNMSAESAMLLVVAVVRATPEYGSMIYMDWRGTDVLPTVVTGVKLICVLAMHDGAPRCRMSLVVQGFVVFCIPCSRDAMLKAAADGWSKQSLRFRMRLVLLATVAPDMHTFVWYRSAPR